MYNYSFGEVRNMQYIPDIIMITCVVLVLVASVGVLTFGAKVIYDVWKM